MAENRIIRYDKITGQDAIGDECAQHFDAIQAHVQLHLAPVQQVLHEIASDFVHVDILHVAPSADRPFQVLVTSGMSDRPMNAPAGCEDARYAELFVCLPPDWPIDSEAFKNERNYWPLRLLKSLARLPHQFNSWLFLFHSVPNGDPPSPYANNTELCGAMLAPPFSLPHSFSSLPINEREKIRFFSVLPLHNDEMNFKLKKGGEALLKYFEKNGAIADVISPGRPSVIRKKSWFW